MDLEDRRCYLASRGPACCDGTSCWRLGEADLPARHGVIAEAAADLLAKLSAEPGYDLQAAE